MNRWVGFGLLLITVGALALRCPDLALRPMHNDEAVNAEKLKPIWQDQHYAYDPNELYGPTLYYATLPIVFFSFARVFSHVTDVPPRADSVSLCMSVFPLLAGIT